MKYLWFLLVLLFVAGYTNAQQQVCILSAAYDIPSEKYFGSWAEFGVFELPLKEERAITKVFHHAESGIDVEVTAYIAFNKHRSFKDLDKIHLTMSFLPDYEARADSIYDKHWKWLSVQNNIKAGNRNYSFKFGCEKMNKKDAQMFLNMKL